MDESHTHTPGWTLFPIHIYVKGISLSFTELHWFKRCFLIQRFFLINCVLVCVQFILSEDLRLQTNTKIFTCIYSCFICSTINHNVDNVKYNTVSCVTLGMLVHGARRGSHTTVPPWSHTHALHLSIARVIRHSFLVHGFHGLMKRWRDIMNKTNIVSLLFQTFDSNLHFVSLMYELSPNMCKLWKL